MGYSAGLSSALLLGVGLWLTLNQGSGPDSVPFVLILLAGGLWFLSVACFSRIIEEPGATEGARSPVTAIRENLKLLTDDKVFRHYLLTRALLLSVALAPPFYTLLAKQGSDSASTLGWLILAGGIAGTVGGPIWGKLSDYSSRITMSIASLACGLFGIAVALLYHFGKGGLIQTPLLQAFLFFVVMTFYAGVRLGRKTYLVDMVSGDKSAYVAVGNTLIGVALLAMGGLGLSAQSLGPSGAIGLLGIVSIIASLVAWRLKEVSA